MADSGTLAERAQRNGGSETANGGDPVVASSHQRGLGGLAGLAGSALRVGSGLARAGQAAVGAVVKPALEGAAKRMTADLDDRDPDLIRERLPGLWLISSIWYRAEVRNLGNVPEQGAVLMVGNHSGGNVSPETTIFTLAFSTYFGVERRYHQLAHNLVLVLMGWLLKPFGTVAASHENARKALESGAAVLVFPGGDWEVHRPSWERNKIDFGGRKGFIKLAIAQDVPIVPVVTVGGQETALFLTRGAGLAKALRLDKTLRLKVLPISVALPWGLNVGDMLGHVPLPAKITSDVLPAINLRERFGPEPDIDEVYEHITRVMQEALDALAAERRYPVIG